MNFTDLKDGISREQKEIIPKAPNYPLLTHYVANLLGHEPDETEIINFFNRKYPVENDQSRHDFVPRVEGMLYKLKSLESPEQFIKNLGEHGLVGTSDGVKIALVNDKVSKAMSDAIIMGNMELLLHTASELDLDIHLGKYSGDEDVFMLIPKDIGSAKNQNELKDLFTKTLAKLSQDYYNQPFFAPAKAVITEEYHETEQIGLHLHLATPNEVKIYHPMRYSPEGVELGRQDRPFKSAMGSIIDAAAGNQILSDENSTSFTQYLTSKTDEALPDSKTLLEFEGMFPKDLQVRKLSTLIARSKNRLKEQKSDNKDNKLYLLRVADVRLKWENKNSGHTKGDHEMIAVANILRRVQEDLGLTEKEIDIYQDNGSLLVVSDAESYNKLAIVLQDPVFLNTYFKQLEQERVAKPGQDQALRADPFIVSTFIAHSDTGKVEPLTIDKDFDEEQIWAEVAKLRKQHLTNEVLVLLYTSGLARSMLDQSTLDLTTIIELLQENSILPGGIDQGLTYINWLATLFGEYDDLRPQFFRTVNDSLMPERSSKLESLASNLRTPQRSV